MNFFKRCIVLQVELKLCLESLHVCDYTASRDQIFVINLISFNVSYEVPGPTNLRRWKSEILETIKKKPYTIFCGIGS